MSPGTFLGTEPKRPVSSELLVPHSTFPSVWKNLLSGPTGLQELGCPDAPRPAPSSLLLSWGTDFSLWVGDLGVGAQTDHGRQTHPHRRPAGSGGRL